MFWWILGSVVTGVFIGNFMGFYRNIFLAHSGKHFIISDNPQRIIEWAKALPAKTDDTKDKVIGR